MIKWGILDFSVTFLDIRCKILDICLIILDICLKILDKSLIILDIDIRDGEYPVFINKKIKVLVLPKIHAFQYGRIPLKF